MYQAKMYSVYREIPKEKTKKHVSHLKRGRRYSVLNFVGHVLSWVSWVSCHRATVTSWVFRGSKNFSRGYFVGLKFFSWDFAGPKFFGGYSWVQNVLSWVFRGSEFFSREYFVGPFLFVYLIS